MLVFRLGKSRFADDLTGEGAKLFGGRWNHVHTACLYTAESRALAVLEYSVNVSIHDIPRALSLTTIEIPDKSILELSVAELPGNWRQSPAPGETRDFGTTLLKKASHLGIKVPSTIIASEYNYILNPLHRLFSTVRIVDIADFVYDVRIKEQ